MTLSCQTSWSMSPGSCYLRCAAPAPTHDYRMFQRSDSSPIPPLAEPHQAPWSPVLRFYLILPTIGHQALPGSHLHRLPSKLPSQNHREQQNVLKFFSLDKITFVFDFSKIIFQRWRFILRTVAYSHIASRFCIRSRDFQLGAPEKL